jgi:hypothetical protein
MTKKFFKQQILSMTFTEPESQGAFLLHGIKRFFVSLCIIQ